MGIDCNDPENKDKPECKIVMGGKDHSLFDFGDKSIKRDIENIENKKICSDIGGLYNEENNTCLVPRKNYLSISMNSFDEVIGTKYKPLINQLKNEIETDTVANFIFTGPTGVGKTQIAELIPKEYAKKHGIDTQEFLQYNTKQISASEKLGVDFIRNQLDQFIRTRGIAGNQKFIIIDEADRLTPDAQAALKTLITEDLRKYGSKVSFIFTTNDITKLDPTLYASGRFQIEKFGLLDNQDMMEIYKDISKKDKINIPPEKVQEVIQKSAGSVRNLFANIYRVSEGNEPYDYTTEASYLTFKGEEIQNLLKRNEIQKQQVQLEAQEIDNLLKKEEAEAKKWAYMHRYDFTTEEIIDALLNERSTIQTLPEELREEAQKNLEGLRQLYYLRTGASPNQLQATLNKRKQEMIKAALGKLKMNKEVTELSEVPKSEIQIQVPESIEYEYNGTKIEIGPQTQPANLRNLILRYYAVIKEENNTEDENVRNELFQMESSLKSELLREGLTKAELQRITKAAREDLS